MATPFKPMSSPRAHELSTLSGDAVRRAFLLQHVIFDARLPMTFTDLDRLAVGGVKPTTGPVQLDNDRETGAEFFLQRRELGIINIGALGSVVVDGKSFELGNLDCLYVGAGNRSVTFDSRDRSSPGKFYLVSCPAHQAHPTIQLRKDDCKPIALGEPRTANQRRLYQYIHPNGIKSCQLVMGFTELAEGSVWNTMPPHTHSRRSEVYFYFDIPQNHVVAHFMGPPDNTRHVFVQSEQAVLSPSWSIHCGCGTAAYRFVWAMAGENQTFDDMDKVGPLDLR